MMDFRGVRAVAIPEGAVIRILSGNEVLWKKSMLPSEYQQVEYVATDGYQYINTGVPASSYPGGIRYVFRGNWTGFRSGGNNHYLFGALNGGKRSGNVTGRTNLEDVLIFIGNDSVNCYAVPRPEYGTDFEFTMTATSKDPVNLTGTMNGETVENRGINSSDATDMPSANIYFLWCSGVGSTSVPFWGKVYGFTMDAADGTPIRNFAPCYRRSDGVIGFYDTVSEAFFTNAGTGSFTKGAEV